MKSFNNLDKTIDKYYENTLDKNSKEESDLKEALDTMSIANNIEKIVSIPTDVSFIVEKGQELRLKNKLRKETLSFIPVASLLAGVIGLIAIKASLIIATIVQGTVLLILFGILALMQKKSKRSEQN